MNRLETMHERPEDGETEQMSNLLRCLLFFRLVRDVRLESFQADSCLSSLRDLIGEYHQCFGLADAVLEILEAISKRPLLIEYQS